jgi:hypothetical protein
MDGITIYPFWVYDALLFSHEVVVRPLHPSGPGFYSGYGSPQ